MHYADLNWLRQKYAQAETKEDQYIKKALDDIAGLLDECDKAEYYYAASISRNFCQVIDVLEKKWAKAREAASCKADRRQCRFETDWDLAQAFYNHYKDANQVDYGEIRRALANGRADLVNPTMKDYVARIYTFAGPKYLYQMFSPEEIGAMNPVLFTYENIELILATFQTRNEDGQIVKQRVNIRSALRKLNEFKHTLERK